MTDAEMTGTGGEAMTGNGAGMNVVDGETIENPKTEEATIENPKTEEVMIENPKTEEEMIGVYATEEKIGTATGERMTAETTGGMIESAATIEKGGARGPERGTGLGLRKGIDPAQNLQNLKGNLLHSNLYIVRWFTLLIA